MPRSCRAGSPLDGRSSEAPLQGKRRAHGAASTTRGDDMSSLDRPAAEECIERALLEQWDPLGVASAPGEHREYQPYAHEVYNLLARGASDAQVARFLHRAEDSELGHPELTSFDLTPLVTRLRTIEREM